MKSIHAQRGTDDVLRRMTLCGAAAGGEMPAPPDAWQYMKLVTSWPMCGNCRRILDRQIKAVKS